MIRVVAYTHDVENRYLPGDTERPLFVCSCGYQHFMTKDYSIHRPDGRADYQLLYILKGCGYFFLNGSWERKTAGSLILYRPKEAQLYYYKADDNPEIYWLHFSGTESETLMEEYEIQNGIIGNDRSMVQIFENLILELQLHKPMFHQIALADFYKLLAVIRRLTLSQYKSSVSSPQVDRLVAWLNKHYMENWTISKMADYCHLSTDYFSHQFKSAMGMSPMQFLNQLRIEQAKELLMTGTLNVSEVAKLVGCQDPLYFSRLFKKLTGTSPKMYHGTDVAKGRKTN